MSEIQDGNKDIYGVDRATVYGKYLRRSNPLLGGLAADKMAKAFFDEPDEPDEIDDPEEEKAEDVEMKSAFCRLVELFHLIFMKRK